MNNLPYNHDMRESLLQKSLFSLDVWSFAKVLMLDLACVKNIACLLGEKKKKKKTRGGRNHFAHLKELVDQCQWGWRILAVTAKSRVSQGPLSEQFLTVHLSSQLPLEDGPSLLHLSFTGLSTGLLSGIPHALTSSHGQLQLQECSESPPAAQTASWQVFERCSTEIQHLLQQVRPPGSSGPITKLLHSFRRNDA